MAMQVEVPPLGESVTQAVLVKWHKADGDTVAVDEPLCELETDKANVDIPAKSAGTVHRLKEEGESVNVGEAIARIDDGAVVAAGQPVTPVRKRAQPQPVNGPVSPAAPGVAMEDLSPAVRRLVEEHELDAKAISGSGPGGRITKEDVERYVAERATPAAPTPPPAPRPVPPPAATLTLPSPGAPGEGIAPHAGRLNAAPGEGVSFDASGVHRVPMSKIRRRIAERLVEAQNTAAILTTFNEIDLTEVITLRNKFKERFQEVHGVGLGFMSFFARATVLALKELPQLNAFLEGNDIVYHNYVHLGIAVSTERGLAVPVLRNVQEMSFARIEAEIKRLATATRDGKLSLEELSGGTFTITNGGVFGSLLSTPILSPPQSGILGMHTIQKRPVVIGDKIEVRSMMYVALSYDHRLVDGREAITFLVRLKQLLEEPARLLLEI
jgi:2-oxoglutarate dehydrogenase E2 component (dihydrolipoamide succinyltransferase)